MRKSTASILIVGALIAYPISYLIVSRNAHYTPVCYGLAQGPDDTTILAPKVSLGYYWLPWKGYYSHNGINGISWLGCIYVPMVFVDRWLWHRPERVNSKQYPTKDYYDEDIGKFCDIK